MLRSVLFSALVATFMMGSTAQAAKWPALPAACTPERAVKWDNSKSESNQAACHCPPTSMCPKTYKEYSNANLSPLPMKLVTQCCPMIQPSLCPAGTFYAGQAEPADGNCNPELCPANTPHAGEPRNTQANNNCGTCPPEGCNPPPSDCPTKYYPSLTQSGISKSANSYNAGNGNKYEFSRDFEVGTGDTAILVTRLAKRYNWSLRLSRLTEWRWGQDRCKGSSGALANPLCPVQSIYSPSTAGHNNGTKAFEAVYGYGPDKLTWFGLSVAGIEPLANNLASAELIALMKGEEFLQIADNGTIGAIARGSIGGFNKNVGGGGNVKPQLVMREVQTQFASLLCRNGGTLGCVASQLWESVVPNAYAATASLPSNYTFNGSADPALVKALGGSATKEFVGQCFNAAGEYIAFESINLNGKQCTYLQCRYIYESTAESCLAGDVKVSLADGSSKAVKELKLGDVVKGSAGDHKIVASNIYQSALRVLYGVNGGGELLTGDHPLHTKEGWKVINPESVNLYAGKAGFAKTALAVGDVLITDKGEVEVKSIERHAKVNPVSTYNIKVEGNAGFYANGIEVKGFDKMEMHYE